MLNKLLESQQIRPLKPRPTGIEPSGRIDGPILCLLFDIYGTLLISGSGDIGTTMDGIGSEDRLKNLLLKFGIKHPLSSVLENFRTAIQTRHALLKNHGTECPEVRIDHIWLEVLRLNDLETARSFALEFELIVNPTYPMPGLDRLLEKARNNGRILGIISNAQFYTPLLFEWLLEDTLSGLGFRQELVIFSYMLECAKPSEQLFSIAKSRLDTLGIAPAHTLYVGNDMLNDIMPAKKIGFKTALFAGDNRSLRLREDDARCRGIEPDMVITELSQLMTYL